MDKYKEGIERRLKPKMDHDTGQFKVEPFRDAQTALVKAQFSARERESFYTEAFSEIMTDLFVRWLASEPHAQKEREYLYSCAMALGSVKEKMIQIEQYGSNMQFIQSQKKKDEELIELKNQLQEMKEMLAQVINKTENKP